jgi:copper oxidase (laccase) domain-containing protein
MAVRSETGRKPHIDLQAAAKVQLERAGVRSLDGNALCTFRDAAEFFSHRRDNGVTGRLAAVIGCRQL